MCECRRGITDRDGLRQHFNFKTVSTAFLACGGLYRPAVDSRSIVYPHRRIHVGPCGHSPSYKLVSSTQLGSTPTTILSEAMTFDRSMISFQMSLIVSSDSTKNSSTWLQRFACNIIRYGCTSRPRHIAIVMDGNRRFASEHHFDRARGHTLGADKLFEVCQWCHDLGINELTAYAFSLENLKRSQDEIDTLMNIARLKLNEIEKSLDKIHEQKISIRIIGNLDYLPADIRQSSHRLMNATGQHKNFILNVCLYYTSRNEIANVIKDLAKGCEKQLIQIDDISDDLIMRSLLVSTSQSGNVPDILLRTSGELRLSDFMLLQCRFSLWIFADVYWPAFNVWHLYWIVLQYEMKSKALIDVQNQCKEILKEQTTVDESRDQRIETYLHWLGQQRLERLKL